MNIKIGVSELAWSKLVDFPTDQSLPYPLWKQPPAWMKERSDRIGFKNCPVNHNHLMKTLVVPWTQDVELTVHGEEFGVEALDGDLLSVSHHDVGQLPMSEQHYSVKWEMPYVLGVRDELVMFTPPFLHEVPSNGAPMFGSVIVPGKLPCSVNCLYDMKQPMKFKYRAGEPLAYLYFPNIDGKVDVEYVKYTANVHKSGVRWLWEGLSRYKLK